MKSSKKKLEELKERLEMEEVSPEQFIQFVYDVVDSMPEPWKNAARRAYLENGGQKFDESTGKPLTEDSRYHIFNEHSRRAFQTLVTLSKKHPQTLAWLLGGTQNG